MSKLSLVPTRSFYHQCDWDLFNLFRERMYQIGVKFHDSLQIHNVIRITYGMSYRETLLTDIGFLHNPERYPIREKSTLIPLHDLFDQFMDGFIELRKIWHGITRLNNYVQRHNLEMDFSGDSIGFNESALEDKIVYEYMSQYWEWLGKNFLEDTDAVH